MSWADIVRKLTSRKLWVAVAEFVAMLIIATNGDRELAEKITALILAAAGVVAYIVGEGLIDSSAAGKSDNVYIEGVKVEDPEQTDE